MVLNSVTIQEIRNATCIICGLRFSLPRAGKLYCSAKCKQFSFYHRQQIFTLLKAKKNITDDYIKLSFKEYQRYRKCVSDLRELNNLSGKRQSRYDTFTEENKDRFEKLNKLLPQYMKRLTPKHLTMEEWAYFKILYSHLCFEEFFKIVAAVDRDFVERLRGDEHYVSGKNDLIRKHYNSHLLKIADGKIIFT